MMAEKIRELLKNPTEENCHLMAELLRSMPKRTRPSLFQFDWAKPMSEWLGANVSILKSFKISSRIWNDGDYRARIGMTTRELIETAFADVHYPGDDNIADHQDCPECDDVRAFF